MHETAKQVARDSTFRCPMNGTRAADLACGAWRTVLDRLLKTSEGSVITFARGLSQEELGTFLTDWNCLSQTFLSGCCLRFLFWDMLPHVLLGLAAVHEDDARQAAAKAVKAWQAVEESGTELAQHPLACKFLQKGSPLRPEVHSLANGVHSLSDLIALKKAVAAFPFIVVAERSIEAKHALAKQGLRMNTNPSPSSVSMSLRFSEIEMAMCEESDFLPSLAVHFEK
eukprot:6250036-Amphidinium_carterae.1